MTRVDPSPGPIANRRPRVRTRARQITLGIDAELADRIEALLAAQPVRPVEGAMFRAILRAGLPSIEQATFGAEPPTPEAAHDRAA